MITSLENEKVKNWCKLNKKKFRDLTNTYLVEGFHLVQEAYKANNLLEIITLSDVDVSFDVLCNTVSYDVMKKISVMDTPSNIIGVCKKSNSNSIIGDRIVLLDDIQDPGNLGTIIRSAVAFNIDTIILSSNTVDLYNSKVLRATQGMYNYLNIVTMDSVSAIKELKEKDIAILGTDVSSGEDVKRINSKYKSKFCLVMGNEGNGVSLEVSELCDLNLFIKMNEKVESLNVGIACSILLYELGC